MLMKVSQVAKELNVSPNTVRRWADSGMIKCYRLAIPKRDRRFKPEDVQVMLVEDQRRHGV